MNAPKFSVGQVVEWFPRHINKRVNVNMTVDVKVLDVKNAFGRYIYTVQPVSGKGSESINEDGLRPKS